MVEAIGEIIEVLGLLGIADSSISLSLDCPSFRQGYLGGHLRGYCEGYCKLCGSTVEAIGEIIEALGLLGIADSSISLSLDCRSFRQGYWGSHLGGYCKGYC